jgi:succinylglutamic semialdehyde dehydrogenase
MNYVGGEWIDGSGQPFRSLDPYGEELLFDGRSATLTDVNTAVHGARRAFDDWSRSSLDYRLELLDAVKSAIGSRQEELAKTISREMGKPFWESKGEVAAMLGKFEVSKKAHLQRCGERRFDLPGFSSITRFHGIGVAAVLGPFNLPGHLPNGHIVPMLIAGNTVIFKPSEKTPRVGEILAECFDEAGLPPGVFNCCQGSVETAQAMIDHPGTDLVAFTGSYGVGREIHRRLGGKPEKLLALEMGGNNALVVHEVGDELATSKLIELSAFITSGQRCVCARRMLIVDSEQNRRLFRLLLDRCAQIKFGRWDSQVFMGPLVDIEAGRRFRRSLSSLRGRCQLRGDFDEANPHIVGPQIVEVKSFQGDEEVFGPLLQVKWVSDFEQAVDEVNDTSYGLAAGLLSEGRENWDFFRKRVRAGVVNWNRQTTGASSEAPFGGVGASGNFRPSATLAADYCAYPCASLEAEELCSPRESYPGLPS